MPSQSCYTEYGEGWGGTYPNCTFAPTAGGHGLPRGGGDVSDLGFGSFFADTTLADDWDKYFDRYDPTREEQLTTGAAADVTQLGQAWDLKSGQLGEQYQQQLGGLFDKAGAGMMNLMSSWEGAGQTMTGRKGRQRQQFMDETGRQSAAFGMGLGQARDTGELNLQQGIGDIYQDLAGDVYSERDKWRRDQRSNLMQVLGMDIYDEATGGTQASSNITTETPCPPGQYMPTVESGLSGCQPVQGATGDTGPTPQEACESQGKIWNGASCETPGKPDTGGERSGTGQGNP